MSKQLKFNERCERMFEHAKTLAECARVLERMSAEANDEAERMIAAKKRVLKRYGKLEETDS